MFGVAIVTFLAFSALLFQAQPILDRWDNKAYPHRVVFSKQTPYQKIALTKNKEEVRLYINRIIQFSSVDEYRYHESLALIPLQLVRHCESVLVLGGGEGLLVRELLKDERIKKIKVIDLDPSIFELARTNPYVKQINQGALDDPRVETIAMDAGLFLQETEEYYDLIIADLPDPSNEAVARLYSTRFFNIVKDRLSADGLFATQATSPFHTRKAFWCIAETIKACGYQWIQPYHTYVPSFGDWGFVVAGKRTRAFLPYQNQLPSQYLEPTIVAQMTHFAKDADQPQGLVPNRIDRPSLLDYYLEDWGKWSKEANKK